MSKENLSHDSVGKLLGQYEGAKEGRERRIKIIKLGRILKNMREKEIQMTQTEASELIGMSQSELSRIEAGVGSQGPSYNTIIEIVSAYKKILYDNYKSALNLSFEIIDSAGQHTTYSLSNTDDEDETKYAKI